MQGNQGDVSANGQAVPKQLPHPSTRGQMGPLLLPALGYFPGSVQRSVVLVRAGGESLCNHVVLLSPFQE